MLAGVEEQACTKDIARRYFFRGFTPRAVALQTEGPEVAQANDIPVGDVARDFAHQALQDRIDVGLGER